MTLVADPDVVGPLVTLRRSTAARHRRLDDGFAAAGWLRDLDSYAGYLERVGSCHAAVEAFVAGRPFVSATGHAPKSCLVDHDLAALGRARAHDPRHVIELPPVVGDGAALGALYVVEGSTLGGRTISGLVRETLPAAAEATRFLDAYGDATMARWRSTLRAIADTAEPVDELVSGAAWAFDLFTAALLVASDR